MKTASEEVRELASLIGGDFIDPIAPLKQYMFMCGFDYAIKLLKSDEARMHESGELTLGNPLNGLDHEEWANWLKERR